MQNFEPENSELISNERELNRLEALINDGKAEEACEQGVENLEEAERLDSIAHYFAEQPSLKDLLPIELKEFLKESSLIHGALPEDQENLIANLRIRLAELDPESNNLEYAELKHELDDFEFELKQAGGIDQWIEQQKSLYANAAKLRQGIGELFQTLGEVMNKNLGRSYEEVLAERELIVINKTIKQIEPSIELKLLLVFIFEHLPSSKLPFLNERLRQGASTLELFQDLIESSLDSMSELAFEREYRFLTRKPIHNFLSSIISYFKKEAPDNSDELSSANSEDEIQEEVSEKQEMKLEKFKLLFPELETDDAILLLKSSALAKDMFIVDTMRSYVSNTYDLMSGIFLVVNFRNLNQTFLKLGQEFFKNISNASKNEMRSLLEQILVD